MNRERNLSLLISHCCFPEELTGLTRQLLQQAILETALSVKVLCPVQHIEHMTSEDSRWPRKKTQEWLAELLPQTDIFLASDPVLESVNTIIQAPLQHGSLGKNWVNQIILFPEKIKTALGNLNIPINRETLDKNLLNLMMALSDAIRERINVVYDGTRWAMLIDELDRVEAAAGIFR